MCKTPVKVSIDTFLDTFDHHPIFFNKVVDDLSNELNHNDTILVITQQKNVNGKLISNKLASFANPHDFKTWINKITNREIILDNQ